MSEHTVTSNTTQTDLIRFARQAIAAALLTGAGFAATATPVAADSFLDGKSNGMRKCVNAILGGYEVKGVNVHGHHFNCKPMTYRSRGGTNYRQIRLSHDQFGKDDQYVVYFRVDSLNVVIPNSISVRTAKGVSLETLKSKAKYLHMWGIINLFRGYDFKGPPGIDYNYEAIAQWARAVQPREVGEWQIAAAQIFVVAIAEHGNPDNRGTAPTPVSCSMPTFYEHDNYRGRAYRLTASQPDLHRVHVQNRDMGNRISSLCVPRGWTATVYDYGDYKGASLRIVGPRRYEDIERQPGANGARLDWGDRISSIRVTRAAAPSEQTAGGGGAPGAHSLPSRRQRRTD